MSFCLWHEYRMCVRVYVPFFCCGTDDGALCLTAQLTHPPHLPRVRHPQQRLCTVIPVSDILAADEDADVESVPEEDEELEGALSSVAAQECSSVLYSLPRDGPLLLLLLCSPFLCYACVCTDSSTNPSCVSAVLPTIRLEHRGLLKKHRTRCGGKDTITPRCNARAAALRDLLKKHNLLNSKVCVICCVFSVASCHNPSPLAGTAESWKRDQSFSQRKCRWYFCMFADQGHWNHCCGGCQLQQDQEEGL